MLVADDRNAVRACDQISDLVDGLSTFLNPTRSRQYCLPQYLTRPVRSVVIGQYIASGTAVVTVAVVFCRYYFFMLLLKVVGKKLICISK